MGSRVGVLIPTGGEPCPHRARALDWIVDRYKRLHPDWPVVIGYCGVRWSKGVAIADAVGKIGETVDVMVLADADSFVDTTTLEAAVDGAVRCGWSMPHAMVHRLDEQATEAVYAGAPPNRRRVVRGAYPGVKGGGIVAIRPDVYTEVNGIDPRFVGWGGEDVSFGRALQCLVGRHARFAGDLFHLYHPHPAPDLRGSAESEALVDRYKAAQNRPDLMRKLVAEWVHP